MSTALLTSLRGRYGSESDPGEFRDCVLLYDDERPLPPT